MADGAESWQGGCDKYHRPLLLFARQFLNFPADAEDPLQEGFIRFWRSRQSARDPAAYLFACDRSATHDARRAKCSRRRHEPMPPRRPRFSPAPPAYPADARPIRTDDIAIRIPRTIPPPATPWPE